LALSVDPAERATMGPIHLPVAQTIFSTHALTASELALCVGASLVVFLAVELEKHVRRSVGAPVRSATDGRRRGSQ